MTWFLVKSDNATIKVEAKNSREAEEIAQEEYGLTKINLTLQSNPPKEIQAYMEA